MASQIEPRYIRREPYIPTASEFPIFKAGEIGIKAVTIGLLPDIDRHKFKYLGNSSIGGAYMALLSDNYRRESREISSNMTYIDFPSSNQFMDEFTSALFLPHTNINAFPSVKLNRNSKRIPRGNST